MSSLVDVHLETKDDMTPLEKKPVASETPVTLEPWVDAKTVARHLGFKPDHIRKLAQKGALGAVAMQNGSRQVWRFRLSVVDQMMAASMQRAA